MSGSFSLQFRPPHQAGETFYERTDGTPTPFRRTATRADLLDAVYASCPSLSRSQAREIFEMALEEVSGALARGESVKLRSFGHFTVREKKQRMGRNPRTGVAVPITPRRVLSFKPSPVLLDQVNGREPGRDADDAHHYPLMTPPRPRSAEHVRACTRSARRRMCAPVTS